MYSSVRSLGSLTTREVEEAQRALEDSKVRERLRTLKRERREHDQNKKMATEFALSYKYKAESRISEHAKALEAEQRRFNNELAAKEREIEEQSLKRHYILNRLSQLESNAVRRIEHPPLRTVEPVHLESSPVIASRMSDARLKVKSLVEQRIEEQRRIAHERYHAQVEAIRAESARKLAARSRQIEEAAAARSARRTEELLALQLEAQRQLEEKQALLAQQKDDAVRRMRREAQREAQERSRVAMEETEHTKEERRVEAGMEGRILESLAMLQPQAFTAPVARKPIAKATFDYTVKLPETMLANLTYDEESDDEDSGPVDRRDWNLLVAEKTRLENEVHEHGLIEEELEAELKQVRDDLEGQRGMTKELNTHLEILQAEASTQAEKQRALEEENAATQAELAQRRADNAKALKDGRALEAKLTQGREASEAELKEARARLDTELRELKRAAAAEIAALKKELAAEEAKAAKATKRVESRQDRESSSQRAVEVAAVLEEVVAAACAALVK
ncbi:Chromosome partition protein Smc [Carpediemonas membranifera]|uniref:Chromosome partition protein Smc n=1 Tax=Carpediemonas membranifera TaxID=201153 RepID=A0A8J6E242_9EUKA|nr:Chromosome partition protein Smc [Carpediemonas membranifera]|eukprot:KAG9394238.1 Chromosome partition protein Smc [Carpediemonas membranifera]